jgi:flavin reductase (DIM6/NTAB) family NADH-FMN oxidoreductase RutF
LEITRSKIAGLRTAIFYLKNDLKIMKTIQVAELPIPILHQYLQSAVAPRPIAFVSSINSEGAVNLSPFSFFNVFGTNPPTLIFSPNRRVRDGSSKHTLDNVLVHDEVVINMVDFAMVEQMSLASCEYPEGVNEFLKSGFSEAKSLLVRPPRVAESKAAFECKVKQVVQLGEAGGAPNLVICEVLVAHFDESILDEKGLIDPSKTDWVARLGGDWYCRASGATLFEVPKPNIQLGVGVDALPFFVRNDPEFSGNELGRLGNEPSLPSEAEVAVFTQEITAQNWKKIAKEYLKAGKTAQAWGVILARAAQQKNEEKDA